MALGKPHIPTSAQLAQLATLQATAAAAATTEASSLATYNTNKAAAKNAAKAAADYLHFIYGGVTKPGVVDGNQDET